MIGTSNNCVEKQNINYLLAKTKLKAIYALPHRCSMPLDVWGYISSGFLFPIQLFNLFEKITIGGLRRESAKCLTIK